ncbi:MAG TPA: FMN-binding protein, partial [Clostridia bacterium]|nr:FMN-binding protein [Clostridia bacterium]
MKAGFKESTGYYILKSLLVLTVIAIVAGALLGAVNYFTKTDENQTILKKAEAFYGAAGYSVFEGEIPDCPDGYVKTVLMPEGEEDAYLYLAGGKGYGGSVELFVLVKGGIIEKIGVYSAKETPGLGAAVLDKGKIFTQFIGTDISALDAFVYTKHAQGAGEVEAVSGSTKTSN